MQDVDRRGLISAEIREKTGITEDVIRSLVHGFYAKVRNDKELGPIFDARIKNWDSHLQRMCAFWSSVVLLTGRYHGRPMEKHLSLPVDSYHFDRWLALFQETAFELCGPVAANVFIERAARSAESLESGIVSQRRFGG